MPRKTQPSRPKRSPRRVCYGVAMSLDGFIAGPNGEADWITIDPETNFNEQLKRFDTMLIGRRTFDAMRAQGGDGSMPGMQVYVFSRTLGAEARGARGQGPGAREKVKIADNPAEVVAALRSQPGKEIALFGGGSLFRSLVEAELVDTVEVAVIPVLLGEGIPLMAPPAKRVRLKLTGSRLYAKTGTMLLEYEVQYGKRGARSEGRGKKVGDETHREEHEEPAENFEPPSSTTRSAPEKEPQVPNSVASVKDQALSPRPDPSCPKSPCACTSWKLRGKGVVSM